MTDLMLPIVLGQVMTRTYYAWQRVQEMTQWWHWMVFGAVVVALLTFIIGLYRRDSVELPRGIRWLLITLRVLAFVGLLIFFLNLEKRSEQKLVKPSRVALLVDTSQSMGLTDAVDPTRAPEASRIEQVVQMLEDGSWLETLRQRHEVTVYRFDRTNAPVPVTSLPKTIDSAAVDSATAPGTTDARLSELRWLWIVGGLFLGLSLLAALFQWLWGAGWWRGAEGEAWAVLVSVLALIVGVTCIAVGHLRNPQIPLAAVFGQPVAEPAAASAATTTRPTARQAEDSDPVRTVDWRQALAARGAETRLGEAIRWVVERERGGPIAGIVVLSDGNNNAGIEYTAALQAAQDAEVPLYPVGLGSEKQPQNVRLVDLEVPPRVYPGDRFTINAFLQGFGFAERTVRVQLLSQAADAAPGQEATLPEDERRVQLGEDGEIVSVRFDVAPSAAGTRIYQVQIEAPANDLDPSDNRKQASVEVVDRKNRVLLFAGGPTREYRFLRNQLYRDKSTSLDVLLQTSQPGTAQEASQMLSEFPSAAEELFQYDCIVAFDPDWAQLDAQQIELLDRWVAEKAGGLVLVAGSVYMPVWTNQRQGGSGLETIRALYPVTFYTRGFASVQLGRVSSDTPWPLQFSDEGRQAEFLWLEDSPTASEQLWDQFAGVFSYFAVKDLKPGAKAYAWFSDPRTAIDDQLPIYMAGQFYGAGRVFYLGSGEMWRLRAEDDRYFERFYTKLIRYVSQGRLLRDSSRGVLLTDKQRCLLGEHISVRAVLSDPQYRPLMVPQVDAQIVQPDGVRERLILRRLQQSTREGTYVGQFTTLQEGAYRVELVVPESENEVLAREVRVRVPELEIENPQRNDAVLSELAKATGGTYFVGLDAALGRTSAPPLANQLLPKDQETYLPGTPDKLFQRQLMIWLLVLICGALSLEWLFRRLWRLA